MASVGRGQKRSGLERTTAGKKKKSTNTSHTSIFELVKSSKVQPAINVVLRHYKENAVEGVFQVKMFSLHSAGCSNVSSQDMGMEDGRLLAKFGNLAATESPPLPLRNEQFCNNFSEFFGTLVAKIGMSDVLFDGLFMTDIATFINSMSTSKYYGICYAATLAAYKIMTALLKLIFDKNKDLDRVDASLNAETSKQSCDEDIRRKIEELQTMRQKFNGDIQQAGYFLQYFQQKVAEKMICNEYEGIRAICMTEIGIWLHSYPEISLQNLEFLRYLQKSIANERERDVVRMICFKILNSLYEERPEHEAYRDILKSFAIQMKKVVISLGLCYAPGIAPQAISLLTKFSKYSGVMSFEDCAKIFKLVYLHPPHREIAKAAGEFVVDHMASLVLKETKDNNQDGSIKMHMLCNLPKFHFANRSPTSSLALLVDSMYECNPVLQDWQCMQELLITGSLPGVDQLEDSEFVVLIEIMMYSIIITATGDIPPGDLFFSLDCLNKLIEEIINVVETNTDYKVLEECAKTFSMLCSEGHPTNEVTSHFRVQLIDNLKQQCEDQLKAFNLDMELLARTSSVSDFAVLTIMAAFSGYQDLYDEKLFDLMIAFASRCENLFVEYAKHAYMACLGMFSAPFMNLSNSNYSQRQITAMRPQLEEIINVGLTLLVNRDFDIGVEALKGICKMLAMANRELAKYAECVHLSPLICEPSKLLVTELLRFIKKFIFKELPQGRPDHVNKDIVMKRECLHIFCNLLVKSLITDSIVLAEIFRHYIKFDGLFKDIIDAVIYYANKDDAINCARSVHLCLMAEFQEMHARTSGRVARTDDFSEPKKLAKQLAAVVSEETTKDERQTEVEQEAFILLHVEGIKFSISGIDDNTRDLAPYIAYLDVLRLFVKLLTKNGCRHVYLKLQELCQDLSMEWWEPFTAYRNALKGIKRKRKSRGEPVDRQLRTRRHQTSDDDEDLDLSSELTHLRV